MTTPINGIYVLQGVVPSQIAAAAVGVKVVEMYDDSGQLFSAAQVAQMETGNSLLLGYFSIGEAENYRSYFATLPPSILGPVDPSWPGDFEVAYWTDAWKQVCVDYINQMISLGYQGAYFDVVSEYTTAWAAAHAPNGDAAGAMVSLIEYLSNYAHSIQPNFQIWINSSGAEDLLSNSGFVNAINGAFEEELFYKDNGTPQKTADINYNLALLHNLVAAGKPVVAIEYVTGAATVANVQAEAAAAGIGYYIANPNLALNGVDTEGFTSQVVNPPPNNVIVIPNLAPLTAVISNYKVTAASTVLTLTDGTNSTKITLSGAYYGSFALAPDSTVGSTDLIYTPNASLSTFTLPNTPVTISAGPVSSVVIATAASLLAADSIAGGTGTGVSNQLQLTGGGTFNLAALAKLTNIQTITAQEGQGPTAQTVTLRAGLNATVNVASDTAADPSPTITIIGAANSAIINLGSGNDTVTLGKGETVNSGGGNNTFNVAATALAGVTIHGGSSGTNTLTITGGGTGTMGAAITGISVVQLAAPTKFVANTTAGLQILGSSTGGDTITLGAPTQSVVAGGPNETVKASVANAGALVSGLGANSMLEITTGGTIALNAATAVTTVKIDAASMLSLSGMSFIRAIGSSGGDTIKAGAKNQTLTGGGGADTLIGFAGGNDTFSDTASGLNGDTITNFLTSDVIDITNLAFIGGTTKLSTAASGANTKVTVTAGSTKSVFTMAGSWSASGFTLASDGAGGTLLTHT